MQLSPPTNTTKDAPETLASKQTVESAQHSSAINTNLPPIQEEDPNSLLTIRKRKYGTKWKQQHLPACRQNFKLFHVFIIYVSLGVTCMGVGGLCFYFASAYPEVIRINYTGCHNKTGTECFPPGGKPAKESILLSVNWTCSCDIDITVKKTNLPKNGQLVLYFELHQFHQNVRRYKKEIDWEQLNGKSMKDGDVQPGNPKSCKSEQFRFDKLENKPIFPCGKVANSYFSDKFTIFNADGKEEKLTETDIAWPSDIKRFKNPAPEKRDKFAYPRDWHEDLKKDFYNDGGVESQHFIVWMRTAALDKFRKKYAHLKLKEGVYTIHVQYRFEVKSYRGQKFIVIAADIEDRPVNYFFFYWYTGVGAFCLLFGPCLLFINCVANAINKSSSSKRPSQRPSRMDHQDDKGATVESAQSEMDNNTTKNSTNEASNASVQA